MSILFQTRQAIMDGFKRIQTGSVEAVQNTAAALSELTLKEDELSETAQVSNSLITFFCNL